MLEYAKQSIRMNIKRNETHLVLVKYSVGPVMSFAFDFWDWNYGFQVFFTASNKQKNLHFTTGM